MIAGCSGIMQLWGTLCYVPYGVCAFECLSDLDAVRLSVPEVQSKEEAMTFVWTRKV